MSLQNKFLALLLPAGLAAAGLILFLIHNSVHAVIVKDLESNVLTVTRAAAQDCAPGIEAASETLLLPRLQALQGREGALYAAALDTNGTVLAHTTIEKKGAVLKDSLTEAVLREDHLAVRTDLRSSDPLLEAAVPVWSAPNQPPVQRLAARVLPQSCRPAPV